MMKRLGLRISYFVVLFSSLRRCSSDKTDIVIHGTSITLGDVVILQCIVMPANIVILGSCSGAL